MTEIFSQHALTAFFQVVMIDLVLAGDNAIVIGLAAAGLPKDQRNKAILVGIIAATILRIGGLIKGSTRGNAAGARGPNPEVRNVESRPPKEPASRYSMVGRIGIEPMTLGLRVPCSTS